MRKILNVVPFVIVVMGCGSAPDTDQNVQETETDKTVTLSDQQLKNAGIEVAGLQTREMSPVLKVNGLVDVPPQNTVSVSVPLGGYLKSTRLLPGMHVRKGDVIAVVEDQQYIQLQQDYLTAKARIGYLESEYNRQRELNEGKASSDKVLQQAESEYKTQRVLITSLKEKLILAGINVDAINENQVQRSINVYSPINGFVTRVNVNTGQYIAPTHVMFELVNPDDIHLSLKVFEKDIDKLYVGQKLLAFTNNNPGKKYKCEVLLIGKSISGERSTEVHCHFSAYDKSLVPGTYMNAEIALRNKSVSVLPAAAVVRYEGRHYIYKATEKKQFEMTEVSVGETQDGFTQIDFVNPADSSIGAFVTKGAYTLLMMMKNKSD